jgi:hypothetical protein
MNSISFFPSRCVRVTDYSLIIDIFKNIGRCDRSKKEKEGIYDYNEYHTKILWIDGSPVNIAEDAGDFKALFNDKELPVVMPQG